MCKTTHKSCSENTGQCPLKHRKIQRFGAAFTLRQRPRPSAPHHIALRYKVKQTDLIGLRQISQQIQAVHQIHDRFGHLGTGAEIVLA